MNFIGIRSLLSINIIVVTFEPWVQVSMETQIYLLKGKNYWMFDNNMFNFKIYNIKIMIHLIEIYLFILIGKKQYIDEKRAQGSQRVHKRSTRKHQLTLTYTPSKTKTPPKNLSYQHCTT